MMRKLALYKLVIISVILLFALVSCSVNKEPNLNSQDAKDTHLEEKNRNPVILETEKYTTEKMEFAKSDFKPLYVFGLDDENIAILMINKQSPDLRRVYVYNLSRKQDTLIFEGQFEGGISFKKVTNGNFLLEGNHLALEIDKQSYELNRIIPYPEGAYEGNSSYDQRQLVYNKEEGLYLHQQNAFSSGDVELYRYDNKKKIRPHAPFWSYDNRKINYALFHRLELNTEFIILDTLSQKQKEYDVGMNGGKAWWFQDNVRLLTFNDAILEKGKIPSIKIIDTVSDQIKEYEKPGLATIDCAPYGDQVLYVHQYKNAESKYKYLYNQIVIFNVATNTSDIVTHGFLNLRSSNFSPSGNKIVFIGNFYPREEVSIYIAQKK